MESKLAAGLMNSSYCVILNPKIHSLPLHPSTSFSLFFLKSKSVLLSWPQFNLNKTCDWCYLWSAFFFGNGHIYILLTSISSSFQFSRMIQIPFTRTTDSQETLLHVIQRDSACCSLSTSCYCQYRHSWVFFARFVCVSVAWLWSLSLYLVTSFSLFLVAHGPQIICHLILFDHC